MRSLLEIWDNGINLYSIAVFLRRIWTPKRKNAKVWHQMVELANQTIVDHLVIHRSIRRVSEWAYEKRLKPDTLALRL